MRNELYWICIPKLTSKIINYPFKCKLSLNKLDEESTNMDDDEYLMSYKDSVAGVSVRTFNLGNMRK
jgi:hypothetical protein